MLGPFCINLVRFDTKTAGVLWDIVLVAAVTQTHAYPLMNFPGGIMQGQFDCEQYLASRLRESWQTRHVTREKLAKHLNLSSKQLQGLETADPAPFHTDGMYLRALQQALDEAQLLQDADVMHCLETLITNRTREPQATHVLQVKQTLNKQLGVAPPDAQAERRSKRSRLVALAGLLLVLLFVLVLVIPNR
jgi:hypothetical protein